MWQKRIVNILGVLLLVLCMGIALDKEVCGDTPLKVGVLDIYQEQNKASGYNWYRNNSVRPLLSFLKELGVDAELVSWKKAREKISGPSVAYDMLFLPNDVESIPLADYNSFKEYVNNGKIIVFLGSAAKFYYEEDEKEIKKASRAKKDLAEFIGVKQFGGGLADEVTFMQSTPLTCGFPINTSLKGKDVSIEVCRQGWYLTQSKVLATCQGGYENDFKAGNKSLNYFLVLTKYGRGHTIYCSLKDHIETSELMQNIIKNIINVDTQTWLSQQ